MRLKLIGIKLIKNRALMIKMAVAIAPQKTTLTTYLRAKKTRAENSMSEFQYLKKLFSSRASI